MRQATRLCMALFAAGLLVGCANTQPSACPTGQARCGMTCVTLKSDAQNCGTCGAGCREGQACSEGVCTCAAGQKLCGTRCVDVQTTASHCGECDHACGADLTCAGGKCGCGPGELACSGHCVSPNTDRLNCGACGQACPTGKGCEAGQCTATCAAGSTRCGTTCAKLDKDKNNCGACGKVCSASEVCTAGQCSACPASATACDNTCRYTERDPFNCGACFNSCGPTEVCAANNCGGCAPGETICANRCVKLGSDPANCGGCGISCGANAICPGGTCHSCGPQETVCAGACVSLDSDSLNCGACGTVCGTGLHCSSGQCKLTCAFPAVACSNACVNTDTDPANCGGCGHMCGLGLSCLGGACVVCNSATTDCDSDGWLAAEGDCCDQPGACGNPSRLVNPGAVELPTNGIDDNCNGLVDLQDTLDVGPCDHALLSSSSNAVDYARALGICRDTVELPASQQLRTWGLVSAQLLRADGSPLPFPDATSIRPNFGSLLPLEGESLVVLSSGVAADLTQLNPGPGTDHSVSHATVGANIAACTLPYCVSDWLAIPNPPLKLANRLPNTPACATGGAGTEANDSVMLVLRLRAPTNARSFTFKAFFYSEEYPEFVCSPYNDQLIALVDTPGGPTSPFANPVDKNLMTYSKGGSQWPISINIASGTSLFSVCETQAAKPLCWDTDVDPSSCKLGDSLLAGSGFEDVGGGCANGGGTGWLISTGNVRPGEIVELRIAIWDVGDTALDSMVLLDNFKWSSAPAVPGTKE